ncbi:hypothetical protein MMC19_001038 [Ptychographa xylographoides]|nr:hypothetical protein [Ptychographa xylographoides]
MAHDFFDFTSERFMEESDDSSPDYPLFEASVGSSVDFTMPQFSSINTPAPAQISNHPRTVSPKDVFADPSSAPASSAITDLSTPGMWDSESPWTTAFSANTSPTFHDNLEADDLDMSTDNFFPSLGDSAVVQSSTESMAPPMSRNQSSPGQSSRGSNNIGRHSSVAGVSARKRNQPLPPITIDDPADIVAVKRARNTAAARKSRQKKMETVERMAVEIDDLKEQIAYWKSRAEVNGSQM